MVNPSETGEKKELVGTEVLEGVLEIAPGVSDETSPGVETKINEQDNNETLDDGTWLKKKVKLTTVSLGEKLEGPAVTKQRSDKKMKSDDEIKVEVSVNKDETTVVKSPADQKVETFVERTISEEVNDDGAKVRKEKTLVKHMKFYKEITSLVDGITETESKCEHLGTEIFEEILEINPDVTDINSPDVEVKTREQFHHEISENGIWLKKNIKVSTFKLRGLVEPESNIMKTSVGQRIDTTAERKVEEDEEPDGTRIRKEITIIKHVKHYQEVTMINGEPGEAVDKSQHVGTEVFEDVLKIAPGVIDVTSPNVQNKTSFQDICETLEDGTW